MSEVEKVIIIDSEEFSVLVTLLERQVLHITAEAILKCCESPVMELSPIYKFIYSINGTIIL